MVRRVTCLVGDKYTEEDNDRLNPDWTYRGEYRKLPGVWNKLAMLMQPGPNFYIDLDSVVRRRLPPIRCTERLAVGLDYWDKEPDEFNLDTRFNSSIMSWVDPQREIWDRFLKSPDLFMRKYRGIDRFLWWECRDLVDTFEDGLYEVHGKPREDCPPILTFSGTGFEDGVGTGALEGDGYPEQHWRESG